jgi:ABC-type phosphate transport system substrate-binding protein
MTHYIKLALVGMLAAHTNAFAGEVIANPALDLSAADVRDIFLGEKQLAGSTKLVPVDNGAAQTEFLEKVIQMGASKYTLVWTKKSFREGMTAPAVKGSDAEVISFVKATPGAVGYVKGDSSGVKVIQKF